MPPETGGEVHDWLQRAERDLAAAESLLAAQPPLPDMVAFHAQQAAEKALKGFLAGHNRAFPFTHNLNLLLPLCQELEPRFARFRVAAHVLTPMATEFRYPGGPLAPSVEDARQALELAQQVVAFVRRQLGGDE